MIEKYLEEAEDFLKNGTQFRLGFIPSEESNPLTEHLDRDFACSPETGVQTLLSCDKALIPLVRKTLAGPDFARLTASMKRALDQGNRIVFSGCGATGRLSILLESAWREAFPAKDQVFSMMTGGEFALVRSVEHFEDHAETGRKQVEEMDLGPGDVLIGITATGETTSVVGTAAEAADRGCDVFMILCVDPAIPASRLDRCRDLYGRKSVHSVSMPCGGMAVTGSTRMQSSTLETLICGAALEQASGWRTTDYGDGFAAMLDGLDSEQSRSALGTILTHEAEIYREKGLVDYRISEFQLDVISDTTERSPTFMIPPFHPAEDELAPEPWAMVRNPECSTDEAWRRCFRRAPRCLEWTEKEYLAIGADELLKKGLPPIGEKDLNRILIGNEPIEKRKNASAIEIFNRKENVLFRIQNRDFLCGGPVPETPLRLFEHLRLKLAMNTISTGTMVLLGRVRGNWMTHLNISNKKLVDRACRIISALGHVSYEEACRELFRTVHQPSAPDESPVQKTLERLDKKV